MGGKRLTIVKLPPQDQDVYFVLESEFDEYLVNEHTCPADLFLGGVQRIIIDGDTDPHGLFEFVRAIDMPEFLMRGHNPEEEWPTVLPEAFENQP